MTIFSITFTLDKDQTEGGRLEHIALLELFKNTRLAFLKENQMSEDCIVPGIGFVISELNTNYIRAAYENDKIKISLDISDISEKRCVLLYKVTKEPKDEVIAAGKTAIVFFDIATNRSTKIPEKFLQIAKKQQEITETCNMISRL